MKKAKWMLGFIVLLMLVLGSMNVYASETTNPVTTPVPTVQPQPTETPKYGLYKEGKYYHYYYKGRLQRSCWKIVDGRKYYFKANGNAVTGSYKINEVYYIFSNQGKLFAPKNNALMRANGKTYYVSPKGHPVPGYHVIKNQLYYVYSNGRCAANEKKGGYTFTDTGAAKSDTDTKLKIKALSVLSQITTDSMTQSEKLWQCWEWCNEFYFNISKLPDMERKNWTHEIALDMLNTKNGCCYGLSGSFAALTKELGYVPYMVDTGTHCWVEINGICYDGMFPNVPTPAGQHPRRNIVKQKIKF